MQKPSPGPEAAEAAELFNATIRQLQETILSRFLRLEAMLSKGLGGQDSYRTGTCFFFGLGAMRRPLIGKRWLQRLGWSWRFELIRSRVFDQERRGLCQGMLRRLDIITLSALFWTPLAGTQSAKTPTVLESLKLNPLKQKAKRKLPKHSKLLRLALWHEPRIASEADAHAMQEKD